MLRTRAGPLDGAVGRRNDRRRVTTADPHRAVSRLLEAAATGDPAAASELLPKVYDELRRLAGARLRGAEHTVQATALVHEAYLRLVGDEDVTFRGRGHFFAAAALAMRHVLVDHARRRGRKKRGGGERPITLATEPAGTAGEPPLDLLDLDAALGRLEQLQPRCAQVVSLRYFAGLNNPEIAAALDVSDATVERDWKFAKAWLHRELARD